MLESEYQWLSGSIYIVQSVLKKAKQRGFTEDMILRLFIRPDKVGLNREPRIEMRDGVPHYIVKIPPVECREKIAKEPPGRFVHYTKDCNDNQYTFEIIYEYTNIGSRKVVLIVHVSKIKTRRVYNFKLS